MTISVWANQFPDSRNASFVNSMQGKTICILISPPYLFTFVPQNLCGLWISFLYGTAYNAVVVN